MNPDRYKILQSKFENYRLIIEWADNHTSEYPGIWLLNACDCQACGSTLTAVRHLQLTTLPDRPCPESVSDDPDGYIRLQWSDDHQSTLCKKWLRNHCPSKMERNNRRPSTKVWDESIIEYLPYMDYQSVSGDPQAHLQFLETIHETGFVILTSVPKARERTEKVASLVGLLKLTNYGIFELEAKPNPEIVGDTAVALNLHTDEAYRIDVPAITLFHILKQSIQGGHSTLADGYHMANVLKKNNPNAFEVLSRIPATFHRKLKEGRWFENSAPIISLDQYGQVTGFRLLDRAMAPVDASPDEIEKFYDALKTLLTLISSGTGMITVKLQEGEMLVFNNQRLLHGRTEFDPGKSHRHVRSCHVDLDEFHSSLRVARHSQNSKKRWQNLSACTRN